MSDLPPFVDPVPENPMFTDDVKLVADILKSQWSLPIGYEPIIQYKPESMIANGGVGYIYIYQPSRSSRPNTVDMRTIQRNGYVTIRISCRHRDFFLMWGQEIYRILLANRRAGKQVLYPYTYMEVTSERPSNGMQGWYQTTLEVKLTSFNHHVRSAGFGDRINRKVDDSNCISNGDI